MSKGRAFRWATMASRASWQPRPGLLRYLPDRRPALDSRGELSTWFGWATEDKRVALRKQFMRATDEPTK